MAEPLRVLKWLRSFLPPFPRTRESSDLHADAAKAPDSRVRGNDESGGNDTKPNNVVPIYVAPKRRDGRGSGR